MAYDIHIKLNDDPLILSDSAVSLTPQRHHSIMRFVYQSKNPLMHRMADFLRDANIENYELGALLNEIQMLKEEMRIAKTKVDDLESIQEIAKAAQTTGKSLYCLCD